MKQKFKQLISFLLVLALVLQLLPPAVFATEQETVLSVTGEAPSVTDSDPEVFIRGEKTEARDENTKHYYLTDGSFMATQFQVPVHYEEDGQWVDIDNTLEPVTMFDGTNVYQAVNGEHIQSFAASLEDGSLMSMADGDAVISMSLWGGGEAPAPEESVPETIPEETEESTVPETEAAVPDETEETKPAETEIPETEGTEPQETTFLEETEPLPSETEAAKSSEETLPEESAGPAEAVPVEVEETVPAEPEEILPEEIAAEEAVIREDADVRLFNRQAQAQILGDAPATFALMEEPELRPVEDVIPDTLSSTVLYEDVYPGVDLRYDLFSYNVKESIIVKEPLAGGGNPYVFTFLLQLTDLTPIIREDGSILLVNSEEETVYTIPAPYMVDNSGVYSDAVTYTMTRHDEGWLLTVTADASWITEETRTFPVTIDPSFYVTLDTASGVQRCMATDSGTFATSTTQIACGDHPTYGKMQPYFKFTQLPELGAGSIVTKANLELYTASYLSDDDGYTTFYIHQVNSAPSGNYGNAVISYSNQPGHAPAMDFIEMNYVLNSSGGKYRYWNITRAVQPWYAAPATNHGLTITTDMAEAAANDTRVWFSIDRNVVLSITYRSSIGVEGYYTSETVSAGAAGTGYVNDYTTNLTVVKPILSYPSTTIPYSLSLVYNSPFRTGQISAFAGSNAQAQQSIIAPDFSAMPFGNGWQLSCIESVKKTILPGPEEDTCYVYRDGDGTQHYFRYQNSDGEYVDEDGLGLTMTVDSGTHILKDKDGNKRRFVNGYLSYIQDGNGNAIYFLYNGASLNDSSPSSNPTSPAKLTSIRAKNKNASSTEICSITYSSGSIVFEDYADRRITCTYDTNGQLASVTHDNGSAADTAVYYIYSPAGHEDQYHLTRMYDAEAKYGIAYGYDGTNHVRWIKEYAGAPDPGDESAQTGTTIRVEKKGVQQTLCRYSGNDQIYFNDDDIVTRYAFDFAGRTINATTLNADQSEIYGVTASAYTSAASTSGSANRVEKDVQSGQNGINLLKAGGCEAHDGFGNMTAVSVGSRTLAAYT